MVESLNLKPTSITGVFTIQAFSVQDERGTFTKVLDAPVFQQWSLETQFRESFFSVSQPGVIRGMHFHVPPFDHVKVVYVSSGSILDVVVDLRRGSPTFGQVFSVVLSAVNHLAVYVPKGCAHGFLAKTPDATVHYLQSDSYQASADAGIRYDSFGFSWPVEHPIVSSRDAAFPALKDFITPFIWKEAV